MSTGLAVGGGLLGGLLIGGTAYSCTLLHSHHLMIIIDSFNKHLTLLYSVSDMLSDGFGGDGDGGGDGGW